MERKGVAVEEELFISKSIDESIHCLRHQKEIVFESKRGLKAGGHFIAILTVCKKFDEVVIDKHYFTFFTERCKQNC